MAEDDWINLKEFTKGDQANIGAGPIGHIDIRRYA